MAKFGTDVTSMSQVNGLGVFSSNVQQGVTDKSAAMKIGADTGLLAEAGQTALDVQAGKAMADLTIAQNKNIQDYMASKQNPAIAAGAAIEAGTAKQTMDQMWQNPNVSWDDINTFEGKYNDALTRYQNAMKQGVMSPDEFYNRVLTTTRQAINQTPGLFNELTQRASSILELSGIKKQMSTDEAAIKAQQASITKMQDYYTGIAKQYNIPVNFDAQGQPDLATLVPQVQERQKEEQILQLGDNATKLTEQQFRQYGPTYLTASFSRLQDANLKIAADPNAPIDTQVAQITANINAWKQSVMSNPAIGPILDKPEVQSTLQTYEKMVDSFTTSLVGVKTQKQLTTALNNQTSMLRDKNYMQLASVMNPEAVSATTNLIQALGPGYLAQNDPQTLVKAQQTLANLVSGVGGALTSSYDIKGSDGSYMVPTAVGQALRDPSKVNQSVGQLITTANSDIKSGKAFQGLPQDQVVPAKFAMYQQMVGSFADPSNREGIKKLDQNTKNSMSDTVADYMQTTLQGFNYMLQQKETAGAQLKMEILPDGRLNVTPASVKAQQDPVTLQAVQDLNSRFINRVNQSIGAMSNILHTDMKSAAGYMLKQYAPMIYQGDQVTKGISGNYAENIQTPQDVLTALRKGQITPEESKAILLDMKGKRASSKVSLPSVNMSVGTYDTGGQ